ncbi:hypothetical protein [Dysgonomonas massiliensis]|uniref:hypothetical protein n=1 Tax=Dysgonomonas massiliensis TaxID=2040292 RepID=UPI000C773DE4|nr:hypothetical protein [Dysgonomonas massiliensis]
MKNDIRRVKYRFSINETGEIECPVHLKEEQIEQKVKDMLNKKYDANVSMEIISIEKDRPRCPKCKSTLLTKECSYMDFGFVSSSWVKCDSCGYTFDYEKFEYD